MRFCGACGTELAQPCSECQFDNPPGFKFCGRCGASLEPTGTGRVPSYVPPPPRATGYGQRAPRGTSSQPPVSTRTRSAWPTEQIRDGAERRQVTVMFCDLVGSVALSDEVDPEELREIVQAYQVAVGDTVESLGGHVAQHLGDGILIYFGYPAAQEDDAQRGVRAALRSIQAIEELNAGHNWARPIQIRVGMHTGVGVIGEVGGATKREQLVIGNTPNIAARLQGIAEPGELLITADTFKLVDGLFEFGPARDVELKGRVGHTSVVPVRSESGLRGRFEVETRRGVRPLVGREDELKAMLALLPSAGTSEGGTVLLTGEAGLGKSRLLLAFSKALPPKVLQLTAHCSPYTQNTALEPLVDMYAQLVGLKRDEDDARRLEEYVQSDGLLDPDAFALLASFLGVATEPAVAKSELSALKRRDKTLNLLSELLLARTARGPVIAVIEDLHWVDPSTLEFIDRLMHEGAQAPLLLVLTARPSFTAPWGFRPYLSQVKLARLTPEAASRVIDGVVGTGSLPADVRRQLLDKADGVPLYLEEMTKALLESGLLRQSSDGFELNLPATLRDSLMSRLDRLGPAKELAQLASVIGRNFSYRLLAAVASREPRIIRRQLDQLMNAELVTLDESTPGENYYFHHALIRDAANDSLLRRTRQEFHRQIADALRGECASEADRHPEFLAWHLEGAGLSIEAAKAWAQAGQLAQTRAANHEAIAHFNRSVKLLALAPDDASLLPEELAIRSALGAAYTATRGWSAPEVQDSFTRARELCTLMGDAEPLFPVLFGLYTYHFVSGNFDRALPLAQQLHSLAHEARSASMVVPAHHALGYATYYSLCDYRRALEIAEEGLALFDIDVERQLVATYQQGSSVALHDLAASSLWVLGYPDQAASKGKAGVSLARQLHHNPSLAFATASTVWGIAQLTRDTDWVLEATEETMKLSSQEDFSFWPPLVAIFRSWAAVERGDTSTPHDIKTAVESYRGIGAGVLSTTGYALALSGYLATGRHQEGLDTATEALSYVEQSYERHFESEIYRLQGELMAQSARKLGSSSDLQQARASVERAASFARERDARSLELRAAMTYAKIADPGPSRRDAIEALREVYDWFTEGFETADLKDARRLLQAQS